MDCVGCAWLHTDGDENYCVKRDKLEASSDLKYPKTCNYGCDGKTIVISNNEGQRIVLTGDSLLLPYPNGYE